MVKNKAEIDIKYGVVKNIWIIENLINVTTQIV